MKKVNLKNLSYRLSQRKFNFLSDEQIINSPNNSIMTADVECYPDYFFVGMKCLSRGLYLGFEESPRTSVNRRKLAYVLNKYCSLGFNFHGYDKIVLAMFLTGRYSLETLCDLSSRIIDENMKPWDLEDNFGVKIPKQWDSIDIMPVAPLDNSLKMYAGRMHCQTMQDLPFEPGIALDCPQKYEVTNNYCFLDCDKTEALALELKEQLNLRYKMSAQYNVDLRSKTDAQIAETVIKYRIKQRTGENPGKLKTIPKFVKYQLPDNIQFKTEALQKAVNDICGAEFKLDKMGKPMWPKEIGVEVKKDKWEYVVRVGELDYALGMGGLHSRESEVSWYANDEYEIADNDVASYYPQIILNLCLFPEHLGFMFLEEYDAIVGSRLHAKAKAKDKTIEECLRAAAKSDASTLKIVINGLFGKFGNKWSVVYSPQLLLQTTISGQLYLLMLIEALELAKLQVISGNTDGIVSRTQRSRRGEVREIIKQWEEQTKFTTEETQYKSVHSRDVNNYFAIMASTQYSGSGKAYDYKPNPKSNYLDERLGVKVKGCYSERGSALNSILSKNAENLVINDAIMQYLVNDVPLEETILNEKDVRRFITIRNVKGGGYKGNEYLGKVVRSYYATNSPGPINYISSGNQVSKSDGSAPLMDLPKEIPGNLDYARYIGEAEKNLYLIGVLKLPKQEFLF